MKNVRLLLVSYTPILEYATAGREDLGPFPEPPPHGFALDNNANKTLDRAKSFAERFFANEKITPEDAEALRTRWDDLGAIAFPVLGSAAKDNLALPQEFIWTFFTSLHLAYLLGQHDANPTPEATP